MQTKLVQGKIKGHSKRNQLKDWPTRPQFHRLKGIESSLRGAKPNQAAPLSSKLCLPFFLPHATPELGHHTWSAMYRVAASALKSLKVYMYIFIKHTPLQILPLFFLLIIFAILLVPCPILFLFLFWPCNVQSSESLANNVQSSVYLIMSAWCEDSVFVRFVVD